MVAGRVSPQPPADHLRKAARFLGTARILLGDGDGEGATSAAYYSVLHTTLALLATRGIATETHSGARQQLGLHFIRPGALPIRLGREIAQLQAQRAMADYDVTTPIDLDGGREICRLAGTVIEPMLGLLAEALGADSPVVVEVQQALTALAVGT